MHIEPPLEWCRRKRKRFGGAGELKEKSGETAVELAAGIAEKEV
jgi:hypothetical protein